MIDKEIIQSLSKTAKENLKKDGYLIPVALLIKEHNIIAPVMLNFNTDDEKYTQYYGVGIVAKEYFVDTIIIINDVALRVFEKKADADHMIKNYITESPLTYPESMRQDGIFYVIIDMISKTSEGFFQRYIRKENKFNFFEMQIYEKADLTGNLVSYILEGYEK